MLRYAYLLAIASVALGNPEVLLGQTTVIGTTFEPSNVEFFGAIPFAQPPLGELRLRPPVLETTLSPGTFNATSYGPACQQPGLPAPYASEDCLTLNIFRPAGVSADAKLPVMVWIYGGAFINGLASLYNGTGIVAPSVARGTPVIFASFGYRLGPLGFPQGVEAGNSGIVNLGLQDQIAALEWIQANIGAFGGDPSKVTIFGESAGAASISIHLLGSKIKSLARAAIIESTYTPPTYGPERNQASWELFVAAIPSCASVANTTNTFDCIRQADSASLLAALTIAGITSGNASTIAPVIDGPGGFLPNRPSLIVPQGLLPSIIGSNLDEGTLFTPQSLDSTDEIYEIILGATSPPIVSPQQQAAMIDSILTLYPDIPALGSPFGTGNDTFGLSSQYKRYAAIFGDLYFQSSRRTFTQKTSAVGVDVFAYYFTDPDATFPYVLPSPVANGSLGICHSSEVPYVLGGLVDPAAENPSSEHLSAIMQDYWISFAHCLNPNDGKGNQRPNWQQYTDANPVLMELNGQDTTLVPDNYREQQIAFFQDNADGLHR